MSSRAGGSGVLFVVSAPSGTGKTTVVERLVEICPNLHRSRSYTSRPPRAGETEGVDYNFISRSAFEAMVARGEFLEWADVFGNLYGTARRDTEAALAAGSDVVLVIDVQGAKQVRERVSGTVGIFVLPPSFQALESRLRGRSQDEPAIIGRRLETARSEVSAVEAYEYVVVNDTMDQCVAELAAIVAAERARRIRRQREVRRIVETFEERQNP
jgi:guanylate kinase